mmetsp:Transcript_10022/g.42127  ORF Transcript_10022/g.42127 Transcript_10022/m.42127 type:complete len:466 (-) Transcript_10022:1361-2758(-)
MRGSSLRLFVNEHARLRLRAEQNLRPVREVHLDGPVRQAEQDGVFRAKPVLDVRQVRRRRRRRIRRRSSRRRARLRDGARQNLRRDVRSFVPVRTRTGKRTVGTLRKGIEQTARRLLHRAPPVPREVPAEVAHELGLLLQAHGGGRGGGKRHASCRAVHAVLALRVRTRPAARALAVLQSVPGGVVCFFARRVASRRGPGPGPVRLAAERALAHLGRVVEHDPERPVRQPVPQTVLARVIHPLRDPHRGERGNRRVRRDRSRRSFFNHGIRDKSASDALLVVVVIVRVCVQGRRRLGARGHERRRRRRRANVEYPTRRRNRFPPRRRGRRRRNTLRRPRRALLGGASGSGAIRTRIRRHVLRLEHVERRRVRGGGSGRRSLVWNGVLSATLTRPTPPRRARGEVCGERRKRRARRLALFRTARRRGSTGLRREQSRGPRRDRRSLGRRSFAGVGALLCLRFFPRK